MTRNAPINKQPWLSQLREDKTKASPINSRIDLSPAALGRLLKEIERAR